MKKDHSQPDNSPKHVAGDNPQPTPQPRRRWWVKALKITGWSVAGIIALVVLTLTLAVWILTPERLTPLVNKYASDYLNAEVRARRVELTYWSTFPRFRVDVDTLDIISHSLRDLDATHRAALPEWADSLLHVDHFDGTIDVPRLLIGDIMIYDVNIHRPAVNLLQATATRSNYDIVPPSEDTEESGPMPDISLGTFKIVGNAPVRYVSLPDSTDINVNIAATTVENDGETTYRLRLDGVTNSSVAAISINDLKIGVGGHVTFDPKQPDRLEISGLKLGIGKLLGTLSSKIRFGDDKTVVETFGVDIPRVSLNDLMVIVPEQLRKDLPRFTTDMTVEADARLTSPWTVGDAATPLPSFDASLKLSADAFKWDRVDLKKLRFVASASIDGKNPDRSTIDVRRLEADGRGGAVKFTLDAKIATPLSDPDARGNFKGTLDLSMLPSQLTARLPMTLKGVLDANVSFNGRMSYLTPAQFHRLTLTGDATLNGFRMKMRDGSAEAFLRHAEFKLGTSDSFVHGEHHSDSLLTASLKIDTVAFLTPEMRLTGANMRAGIGCLNKASSGDTTQINPIGGSIKAKRLSFISDVDTIRLKLRDVSIGGALTRYEGGKRDPLLLLNIGAGKVRFADRFNRASLTDGSFKLKLHPRPLKTSPRMQAAIDSIGRLHPGLPSDSIRRMAVRSLMAGRRLHDAQPVDSLDRREMLDMKVDRSVGALLRKWQAEGSVKVAKVRVMTPYFPLKCRMTNLDMAFTTDEIKITNTGLKLGDSDFTINGTISNITRAVTSSRGAPIKVDFDVRSGRVDVNQLATAAFAGSAFAAKDESHKSATSADASDEVIEATIQASSGETGALLVPSNIDARLNLHADKVSYSDIILDDLTGAIRVYDGALNFDQLSASTEIGRVNLTALYSAPTLRDLEFAFGLQLKDFHISKFLDMLPAVDSLMPLLRDVNGIINADIVATTALDPQMNIDLPSLSAALKISGDSLVLLDAETFRKIGKWLLFKNKGHNMVDHMSVELTIDDSQLQLYPFMFDIDRYKLGVMGGNDLAMNYKYHISVLKSPIPFKFGINVSGNPDKMKIRLGGAKFKEKMVGQSIAITDTTRVNLLRTINNAFRKGVKKNRVGRLRFDKLNNDLGGDESDTISHSDSLLFIREGVLPAPPRPVAPAATATDTKKKSKKKK